MAQVDCICERCGHPFQVPAAWTRRSKSPRRFCSRACLGQHQREIASTRRIEHFWGHVQRGDGNACWVWIGVRNSIGYGCVSSGHDKTTPAHRFAWELVNGPIPAGMYICHRCDNPPCVRPDHLFLGTHLDNMADMVAKGRGKNPRFLGEEHPRAKLTEDDVRAIWARHRAGLESNRKLAKEYMVGRAAIDKIIRRENWAHIPV